MSPLDSPTVQQLLIRFFALFFLFWGIVGAAIGVGLVAFRPRTLAMLGTMNRWISTRRVLRPLELPHQVQAGAAPRWLGPALVVAGAFVVYCLATVRPGAVVAAVTRGAGNYSLAAIGIETLWWLLVLGGVVAVVVGLMLMFTPHAWAAIEARLNKWESTRRAVQGGDEMHVGLDRWVEAFPRAAGLGLAVASLAMAAASWLAFSARF